MKYSDQKIYRTFDEFEREELRRGDGLSSAMDELLAEAFADQLDAAGRSSRGTTSDDDDE